VVTAAQAFDKAAAGVIGGLTANRALASQLAALEFADMKPTGSTVSALREKCGQTAETLKRFRQFLQSDLGSINSSLAAAQLPIIPAPTVTVGEGCGLVVQ